VATGLAGTPPLLRLWEDGICQEIRWSMTDDKQKQIRAFNQLQFEQGLESLTIGMLTHRTPTENA
jgi:hypothetical protein